ncbi:hypothetical protein TREMEDRAFT_59397 [Tremella mesenterica DSM 1558]|uniref:uncharacterized protein n=1 Tax=Tremella mesenterica (strain ATCC 24925 / CBS 8224 / DSM 1558 / NBRC 9311 / NRRL Y-6157 / RJB 2259-6 / UBC 559-6) TaxID=578456 RepID=UPI0003F48D95|nr:uncharacterized protein TREMEDRAFT_59397 [Tremella mesenterica DSM 1558]EIW73231.1 hypothetical protein TREMEDRAFT_59397 [Tremella mesenterica DSM 1558]
MSSWDIDVSLRQGTRRRTTANYTVVIRQVVNNKMLVACEVGRTTKMTWKDQASRDGDKGIRGDKKSWSQWFGLWWLIVDSGLVMVKGGLVMVVARDVTTWFVTHLLSLSQSTTANYAVSRSQWFGVVMGSGSVMVKGGSVMVVVRDVMTRFVTVTQSSNHASPSCRVTQDRTDPFIQIMASST